MEKNIIESLGLKLQHDNKYKCFLNLPNFCHRYICHISDILHVWTRWSWPNDFETTCPFYDSLFRSRLKIFDLGEYDARVKLFSKEGAMITCIISKVIFCMSKRTILSVCKLCDTINFGEALPAFSMWPKTKKTLRPLHLKNHKVYQ